MSFYIYLDVEGTAAKDLIANRVDLNQLNLDLELRRLATLQAKEEKDIKLRTKALR